MDCAGTLEHRRMLLIMLMPSMSPLPMRLLPEMEIQPMRQPAIMWLLERPFIVMQNRSGARLAMETCSSPSMTRRS